MKFIPGINMVLVLPEPKEEKIGSIYVPENKVKVPNYGTVIAVGKLKGDYAEMPEPPKEGMKVLWNPNWEKQAGYELDIDDKRHYVFHIELIMGELKHD